MAVHNVRALAVSQWALSESDGGRFAGPGPGPLLQGTIYRQPPVPARDVQLDDHDASWKMRCECIQVVSSHTQAIELAWRHIYDRGDTAAPKRPPLLTALALALLSVAELVLVWVDRGVSFIMPAPVSS